MSETIEQKLAETINVAFEECQVLLRELAKRDEVTRTLRAENEKLSVELEKAREELKSTRATRNYDSQIQDLFRKNAQKQMEIESLQAQLKVYIVKTKRSLRTSLPALSHSYNIARTRKPPAETPDVNLETHPETDVNQPPALSDRMEDTDDGYSNSNKGEVFRTYDLIQTKQSQHHSVPNDPPKHKPRHSRQSLKRRFADISSIGEDGNEDGESGWEFDATSKDVSKCKTEEDQSAYSRLDSLLSAPMRARPLLNRPRSCSPRLSVACPQAGTIYAAQQRTSTQNSKHNTLGLTNMFYLRPDTKAASSEASANDKPRSDYYAPSNPPSTNPRKPLYKLENLSTLGTDATRDLRAKAPFFNDVEKNIHEPCSIANRVVLETAKLRSGLHKCPPNPSQACQSCDNDSFPRGYWYVDFPPTQEKVAGS